MKAACYLKRLAPNWRHSRAPLLINGGFLKRKRSARRIKG